VQPADRELDAGIANARPRVSPSFADDVMRRVAFVPANRSYPLADAPHPGRGYRAIIASVVLAAAAAIAIAVVIRRDAPSIEPGFAPERVAVVELRDAEPPAAGPIDAPLDDKAAKRAEILRLERAIRDHEVLQADLMLEPQHAKEAKMQRCSACHVRAKPAAGALAIVGYLDLEASDTPAVVRSLEALQITYRDRVQVDVKLVPRSNRMVALAALSAGQQGKLWLMLERIAIDPDRSMAKLAEHATAIGLDMTRYEHGLSDHAVLDELRDALADASRRRIANGFVVGTRTFTGANALTEVRRFAIRFVLDQQRP
jgi:hypothetical protein